MEKLIYNYFVLTLACSTMISSVILMHPQVNWIFALDIELHTAWFLIYPFRRSPFAMEIYSTCHFAPQTALRGSIYAVARSCLRLALRTSHLRVCADMMPALLLLQIPDTGRGAVLDCCTRLARHLSSTGPRSGSRSPWSVSRRPQEG